MAVYKVPQDVEAEDKLIGPFSFRQFIYLIVAALGIATAFLLFRIFPVLVIIPIPIIILFLAIALPLRKDQPMETYLLAIVRFYLKPRNRIWNPDGTLNYVVVTAPKVVEEHLSKDITGEEVQDRLDYLARVMDSRGWASKGVESQGSPLVDTITAEAESVSDIMDDHANLAQSFDSLILQREQQTRQEAVSRMQQVAAAPAQALAPAVVASQTAVAEPPVGPAPFSPQPTIPAPDLHFNPYPTNMHQQVIRPIGDQTAQTPAPAATAQVDEEETSMPTAVSPDIMRLANNNDLSISAIAHEAHRLEDQGDQEVVISLR